MPFDMGQAMRNLNIKPMRFSADDNPDAPKCRGYSRDRGVAISPDERWPELVTFHEMGHILMGHTEETSKLSEMVRKNPYFFDRAVAIQKRDEDLKEQECHLIAIVTASITGVPFDIKRELRHLAGYHKGRDLPPESLERVERVAQQIAEAGGVRFRPGAAAA